MDSYYVTEPNAKRLAAQGYKGEFPQMVWCRHYITNKPYLTFWTTSVMNKAYIPAPTHLAALEWLEKNVEEFFWERSYPDEWLAHFDSLNYAIGCDTADDLLSAILDHLEGVSREDRG